MPPKRRSKRSNFGKGGSVIYDPKTGEYGRVRVTPRKLKRGRKKLSKLTTPTSSGRKRAKSRSFVSEEVISPVKRQLFSKQKKKKRRTNVMKKKYRDAMIETKVVERVIKKGKKCSKGVRIRKGAKKPMRTALYGPVYYHPNKIKLRYLGSKKVKGRKKLKTHKMVKIEGYVSAQSIQKNDPKMALTTKGNVRARRKFMARRKRKVIRHAKRKETYKAFGKLFN